MRPTFVNMKELVGHEYVRSHDLALFMNVRFIMFLAFLGVKCNMKLEEVVAIAGQLLSEMGIEQEQ